MIQRDYRGAERTSGLSVTDRKKEVKINAEDACRGKTRDGQECLGASLPPCISTEYAGLPDWRGVWYAACPDSSKETLTPSKLSSFSREITPSLSWSSGCGFEKLIQEIRTDDDQP